MYLGRISFLAVYCFILTFSTAALAQKKSKKELENEKQQNLQRIKEAEVILLATGKEKEVSVGQLNAINHQINARESLIVSIKSEINLLDDEVIETNSIVESLESDLENLKEEYAAMAYAAYKAQQGYHKLAFIFSASSFNQLFMRVKYMQQYSEARQTQAREIVEVTHLLNDRVIEIKDKKLEKDSLLRLQVAESVNLDQLKKKQNKVVKSLEQKESKIKEELAANKEAVAKLDKLIGELIKSEIAKTATATKKKSADKVTLSVEGTKLSSLFEGSRTKLNWPVSTGFIAQKFGKQKHPTLRGILINNNGVNIQTNQNEDVKAVFEGEVVRVAFVAGMGNVVVIKHGDYFTLYSKLKGVKVKKGQVVGADQIIGNILTDKDGVSELHFEIWKNLKLQNPELWLSRR